MEIENLHLLSKWTSPLLQASRVINEYLSKRDVPVSVHGEIKNGTVSEFYSVIKHGNEPKNQRDNWILFIHEPTFDLVNKQKGANIFYTYVNFRVCGDVDAEKLLEEVGLPDSVIVQRDGGDYYQPWDDEGSVPFSYDPSQDYYTDPWRH